jgi:hypothetical protein
LLFYFCYWGGVTIFSCEEQDFLENKNGHVSLNSVELEDELLPSQVEYLSLERKIKYGKYHLDHIAKALLGAVDDQNFRSLLYAEIAKQKTGEYSVLLSALFKISSIREFFSDKKIVKYISKDKFLNAQNAFYGVEGKILYPQIFIPYFERHSESNSNDVPIIAIGFGQVAGNTELNGLTVDDSGRIVKVKDITEEFAKENEVWILSLNEIAQMDVSGSEVDTDKTFEDYPPFLFSREDEKTRENEKNRNLSLQKSSSMSIYCFTPSNPSETDLIYFKNHTPEIIYLSYKV